MAEQSKKVSPAAAHLAEKIEAVTSKAMVVVEGKKDKFRRLVNKRTDRAERYILGLCPLSTRGSYEYTEEQVQAMLSILSTAVNAVRESFRPRQKVAQANRI